MIAWLRSLFSKWTMWRSSTTAATKTIPDLRPYSARLLGGVRVMLSLGVEPPPFLLWMIERAEGSEPRITKPFKVGRVEYTRKLFWNGAQPSYQDREAERTAQVMTRIVNDLAQLSPTFGAKA